MVTEAQNIGAKGEAIARQFLEEKEWVFVSANWSCRAGEIDLIMRNGSILVFVEIRVRDATVFGEPLETIGWKKQHALLRAARYYQVKEDYWGDIRFDVISIRMRDKKQYAIDHIEHAFTE